MDSKSLTAIVSPEQETNELEREGLWIQGELQQRLGSTYAICRPNPQTYGWTVFVGESECGGFVWWGQWVHVYGAANAPDGDVAFVKNAVSGAIESLGGAE